MPLLLFVILLSYIFFNGMSSLLPAVSSYYDKLSNLFLCLFGII